MSVELKCKLNAMNDSQRARYRTLRMQLNESTVGVQELETGYAFQHPTDMLMPLAEFIDLERLCCPFFRFTLVLEEESRALWLHMTGENQAIKETLRMELGLS